MYVVAASVRAARDVPGNEEPARERDEGGQPASGAPSLRVPVEVRDRGGTEGYLWWALRGLGNLESLEKSHIRVQHVVRGAVVEQPMEVFAEQRRWSRGPPYVTIEDFEASDHSPR